MHIPRTMYAITSILLIAACWWHYHTGQSVYTAREQALKDLAYMVNEIAQNHPGMYNTEDPHFAIQLRHNAYIARAQLLDTRTTIQQCQQIITTFIQSFDNDHLRVLWHQKDQPAITPDNDPFTAQQIAPGIWWLSIPTFYQLNTTQQQQFNTIIALLPTLRSARAIIFDIRGNKGGNSSLGTQLVAALFGSDYTHYKKAYAKQNEEIDWRATKKLYQHARWLKQHTGEEKYDRIAAGIARSVVSKKPFYREQRSKQIPAPITTHPVTTQIACVIHGKNGSAALDFLDDLHAMDYPINLIGQTTAADRVYMELRTTPLPSGLGSLAHPVKVYRNRMRKDKQPYRPHTMYDGDMSDTASVQSFVLSNIAAH